MNKFLSRRNFVPFAVAGVAASIGFLQTTGVALATAANADEFGMGTHIDSATGLITGNFAKAVAAILVLGGVFMIARGHDMGENAGKIGSVAVGIGVLFAIPSILNKITAVSGTIIPHVLHHAHHAIYLAH